MSVEDLGSIELVETELFDLLTMCKQMTDILIVNDTWQY